MRDNRNGLEVNQTTTRTYSRILYVFPPLYFTRGDETKLPQQTCSFIKFWREKGGVLSSEVIQKLKDHGVNVEVGEHTNYKTDKKPVRMDYLDDIDIAEFKEIPTYKRMCVCIMKNDHLCKYM